MVESSQGDVLLRVTLNRYQDEFEVPEQDHLWTVPSPKQRKESFFRGDPFGFRIFKVKSKNNHLQSVICCSVDKKWKKRCVFRICNRKEAQVKLYVSLCSLYKEYMTMETRPNFNPSATFRQRKRDLEHLFSNSILPYRVLFTNRDMLIFYDCIQFAYPVSDFMELFLRMEFGHHLPVQRSTLLLSVFLETLMSLICFHKTTGLCHGDISEGNFLARLDMFSQESLIITCRGGQQVMENLARGYLPTCRCFLSDHDFIHTPGTKLRAEGTHYCCSVDVSEKFFRIRICRQIEEGGEVCMDSALDAFVTKETEESQEQSCPPFSDSLVPYLKEKVEIQEELSAEPQKTEQETSKKFSTKTKKTIGEWNRIEKQFQFFHDLQSLWFTWCSLLERFAVEGSVFSYPSHTRPFKDHELFALYRWKKSLWELSDGDLEAHFDVSMSSNMTNPKSFLPEILDLIKRLMVCFRRAIRKSMETLEPLHLDTVFLKDVQTIIENLDTVPFLSSCLRSLNSFKVLQEMNEIFL